MRCLPLIVALLFAGACSDPAPPVGPTPNGPGAERPDRSAEAIMKLDPDLTVMFDDIAAGRYGPARVKIRKHLNVNPDDGQAAFLFGLSYHREKRYGEARAWFDQAARDAPNYQGVPYFQGWCLYYLGELDSARASFDTHLELVPDAYDSWFALGLIELDEGRPDDAEPLLRKALALIADDAPKRERSKIHTRLSDVHAQRDEHDQARAELETALDIWSENHEAAFKLHQLLLRLELEEEAEAVRLQYEALFKTDG